MAARLEGHICHIGNKFIKGLLSKEDYMTTIASMGSDEINSCYSQASGACSSSMQISFSYKGDFFKYATICCESKYSSRGSIS